jgi:hypothetical protein
MASLEKKLSFENTFDSVIDFASLRPRFRQQGEMRSRDAIEYSVSSSPQLTSERIHINSLVLLL